MTKEFRKRKDRKKEHIDYFMKSNYKRSTLFENIYLEHNALPELNLEDIDTKTVFMGKKIDFPLMINAITGGTDFSREINVELARLAKNFNIPIAVGSQTIALQNEDSRQSFEVVRDILEDGVVIANLSASASIDEVNAAIDMLSADGIQLHLNVAQELSMKEGDRNFKGIIDNINNVANSANKPVIVKEVGFGISRIVAEKLYDVGVRYIDVSGAGGTNFIEIENMRNDEFDFTDVYSWGIPTALSLLQCTGINDELNIIASGGIKGSQEVVKSLCIGAKLAGISGQVLRHLLEGGFEDASNYLKELTYKIKVLMLLLGKQNLEELHNTPYKIKGELKELL